MNNPYSISSETIDHITDIAFTTLVTGVAAFNPIAAIPVALITKSIQYAIKNETNEETQSDVINYTSLFKAGAIYAGINECEQDKYIILGKQILDDLVIEENSDNIHLPELKEIIQVEIKKAILDEDAYHISYLAKMLLHVYINSYISSLDNQWLVNNQFVQISIDQYYQTLQNTQSISELSQKVNLLSKESSTPGSSHQINCANSQYVKNFNTPLYLHKQNNKVTLKNLFVMPQVKPHGEKIHYSIRADHMLEITSRTNTPLIIQGDGGSGKTTLISWLAYISRNNSSNNDSLSSKRIIGNKKLIIVRLRELEDIINCSTLYKKICSYLKIDPYDESFFSDKYIVLDGLDELILIENNLNWEDVLDELLKTPIANGTLLITSRLGITNDNDGYSIYDICEYTTGQKESWIDLYETYTNTCINSSVKKHILDTSSIFSYPQLMYMIAGEKPHKGKWAIDNEWSIYHHIFFDEIYSKPNDTSFHPMKKYRKELYKLYELIGYTMYCYDQTIIDLAVVNKLIDNNIIEFSQNSENTKSILKDYGYGLCCFWKRNSNKGKLEYLHNNIKDFFIAEYVYDKLNDIAQDNDFENKISNANDLSIENELFGLLGHNILSPSVLHFIKLRTRFYRSERQESQIIWFKKTDNISVKYDGTTLPSNYESPLQILINKICTQNIATNIIFLKTVSNHARLSIFQQNVFTLICTIFSDNHEDKYLLLLPVTKTLNNKSRNCLINSSTCLKGVFIDVSKPSSPIICLNLSNIYLGYAVIGNACLNYAILKNAYLHKAYLYSSTMDRAIFDNTNLYRITIINSFLTGASFKNALLNGSRFGRSLFNGADFTNAKLCKCKILHCSFFRANLTNAILCHTVFLDTSFDHANLTGTDLRGSKFDICEIKKAYNWEKAIYDNDPEKNVKLISLIEEGNSREFNNVFDVSIDLSDLDKSKFTTEYSE